MFTDYNKNNKSLFDIQMFDEKDTYWAKYNNLAKKKKN